MPQIPASLCRCRRVFSFNSAARAAIHGYGGLEFIEFSLFEWRAEEELCTLRSVYIKDSGD